MTDQSMGFQININVNQSALAQTNNSLKSIDNQFKTMTSSMVAEGRKLSQIGTEFDRLSKSILNPLTQAADEYAKRFKGLEAPANAFLAAQQKQKDAMADLGRVAATALIPRMNELASITEKIANFAAAHPDLVSTAVNIASVTAMAGGTLIAVGQAASTLGRIQQVVTSGGLVGSITSAVVGIAALAGGAQAAVIGLNKIGEVTGNTYLATYNFGKALDTGRQLASIAILGVTDAFIEIKKVALILVDALSLVPSAVKSSFDNTVDKISTAFEELKPRFEILLNDLHDGIIKFVNGLITGINGLITSLNNTLHTNMGQIGTMSLGGIRGAESPYQELKQDEANLKIKQALSGGLYTATTGLSTGIMTQNINSQYNQDKQTLGLMAGQLAQFAQTGTLGTTVDSAIGGIKANVSNAFGGKSTTTSGVNGSGISPEAVNAFIDYQKQIATSNIKYKQDEQKIITSSNNAILKAEQDHATAILNLHQQDQQEQTDLLTKQFDARSKAQREFLFNEQEIAKKEQFDKLQKQRETNAKLGELAANNDVAGFIEAQKQANLSNSQQAAQDAFDKQDRLDKFNEQQAEQAIADKAEFDKMKADQANKESELNKSYKQQLADLNQSRDDQLAALKQSHADEMTQYEQHFAETLSGLTDNIAGLTDIRNGYYADETTALQNFVATNKATLQQLYSQTLPTPTGNATSTSGQPAVNAFTPKPVVSLTDPNQIVRPGQLAIPSFYTGAWNLPTDTLANVHKGEMILPPYLAKQVRSGSGSTINNSPTIAPNIQIGSVGEHVSKADLEAIKEASIVGSLEAYKQMRLIADGKVG